MRINWKYDKLILPLKLLAAVVVVWWLIAHGILDLAVLHVAVANPLTLTGVFGLALLTYLISGYRWRLLLKCQGVRIPVRAATSITFLGLFLNSFLPGGGVGGEVVRVAYVVRALSARRTVAVLSVLVDRLLGFYSILLIAFAVALLNPINFVGSGILRFLSIIAAVLCFGMPVGLYLFYTMLKSNSRLREFMETPPNWALAHAVHRLFEALRLYRNAPSILVAALGMSVLTHTIGAVCIMIIGSSMGLGSLASIDYAFAAPWAWLANLLPITPGGLGVGEAAFDRICHMMEAVRTIAAYGTIFLVYRIVSVLATLPGLVVYLINHETIKIFSRSSEKN